MAGVLDFLTKYSGEDRVSFHMPGHKGKDFFKTVGYDSLGDLSLNYDITEISGADNLFQPESIVRETMDKYKELYGTKESYLLVNGSSSGIMAAILTVASEGDKVLVARNSHKSVFNGLALSKAQPIYVAPEKFHNETLPGEISTEAVAKAFDENENIKAVVITSPNYYGVCSDIKAISEIAHKNGAVLIVDQAHGAHLKFLSRARFEAQDLTDSMAAEDLGADIVINSIHKTLASFTQSAILNLCNGDIFKEGLISKGDLEENLQKFQSTSPSYLLMASLDANADIIENYGEALFQAWDENLKFFYEESLWIKGLLLAEDPMMERTKINLDMTYLGLSGDELMEKLEKRGIDLELSTTEIAMVMTGLGNRRSDYERLLSALREISHERIEEAMKRAEEAELRRGEIEWERQRLSEAVFAARSKEDLDEIEAKLQALEDSKLDKNVTLKYKDLYDSGEIKEIPRRGVWIKIEEAERKISVGCVTPYPPGVPTLCPGEIVSKEKLEFLVGLRDLGKKVIGIDGEGRIKVGS